MDSKKKKGTQVTVDSRSESVQQNGGDMSKYRRAVSNKSTVDYSSLKLVRSEAVKQQQTKPDAAGKKVSRVQNKKKKHVSSQERKKPERPKGENKGAAKDNKEKKTSAPQSASKRELALVSRDRSKGGDVNKPGTTGKTAEERYSNALGSGDHYSSAVEKYYLKYPNVKRPDRPPPSSRTEERKRKKRRTSADRGGRADQPVHKPAKRSIAEIAVKNKSNSGVRERAKAARDAKAKGTVSPRIANQSFHRRRKKRSGALNVFIFSVIAGVIVITCAAVFFDIKQIRIEGESPYSEAEIKKRCAFKEGNNIIFIDTDGTEKKILTELPYISECSVERKIPSVVVIKISAAEALGVAPISENKWAIISTEGKILESVTNIKSLASGATLYEPKYASAADFASEKEMPLIEGLNLKNHIVDGLLSDKDQLKHLAVFKTIKDAFNRVKMEPTSLKYGVRGYEGEFARRIAFIFGQETDKKTIGHYVDEAYNLIFTEGKIDRDAKGELRFIKNKVFYRPIYEQSEEELEKINQKRRESNRKRLIRFGEIFMSAGAEWLDGKLRTE